MAPIDVEVRRLGDDDELRLEAVFIQDVLPAQPVAVLLHDGAGKIDRELVVEPEFPDEAAGVDHRCDPALLVDGTAPPDLAVLHERLERVEAPLREVARIDRVDVAVEGDHARARADAPDDVAEAVDAHLVELEALHLPLDDGDRRSLLGGE